MIQKTDIQILLEELKETHTEASDYLKTLYKTNELPLDAIEFINHHRPFEVAQFYEKLRKSYNAKKSPLYKNIVDENLELKKILTTLTAYLLQAELFAEKTNDSQLFIKNSRVEEVSRVIHNYYINYDINSCRTMLRLIKADIKLFEAIK